MTANEAPTPGASPPSARVELLALQRGIVSRLKAEIHERFGELPPAVQIYYDEYWREVSSFDRLSSREELLYACAEADVVYLGDYHTLPAAQHAAHELIASLSASKRPLILGLEMVPSAHQHTLDAWLVGEIDEEAFLEAIDYTETWNFAWPPYRRLLELARQRGIPVLGLNSEPALNRPDRVLERDFAAARVINEALAAHPGALIFVFHGDLHVASDHLPLIVRANARKRGLDPKQVVVHQNAEPIYWQLAEQGLERIVDVVRIKPSTFCLFSATPFAALQSYLMWAHDHAEAADRSDPIWRGERSQALDLTEHVHEIVHTLARFLEIDHPRLDDFEVYTGGDLEFLDVLARERRLPQPIKQEIEQRARAGESCFVPLANVIYLSDHAIYRTAEQATHFLHALLAGFDPAPRTARDAFYARAVEHTFGFFGSRVLDPRRHCMSAEELRRFLETNKGRRLDEEGRALRELARLALKHLEATERYLSGRRSSPPSVRAILNRPSQTVRALARTLGYILGDKLYAAVLAGRLGRDKARALFATPLAPGRAEAVYFGLWKTLTGSTLF